MKNLEGKVAFITGGASGIGLGMCQAFMEAGMRVVIADIRQEALDIAMETLKADSTSYPYCLRPLSKIFSIRVSGFERSA